MVQVTVTIMFEAMDHEDAEAKILGWTLHEGCTVMASPVPSSPTRLETDADGNLSVVPEPEPLPPPPPEE